MRSRAYSCLSPIQSTWLLGKLKLNLHCPVRFICFQKFLSLPVLDGVFHQHTCCHSLQNLWNTYISYEWQVGLVTCCFSWLSDGLSGYMPRTFLLLKLQRKSYILYEISWADLFLVPSGTLSLFRLCSLHTLCSSRSQECVHWQTSLQTKLIVLWVNILRGQSLLVK